MSEPSIRAATEQDLKLVAKWTQDLIKESVYGKFFEGYELSEAMLKQYVEKPLEKFCLIIGDNKGFAMFDTMLWPNIDKEVKFSRMPFVYIEPDERKKGLMDVVLEAFEYWSKKVGAKYCTLGSGNKKRGYKKAESVYIKEI